MTEAQLDQVYEVREKIEKAITDLVNEMTKNLDSEVDELIRMQLTENYRFWR